MPTRFFGRYEVTFVQAVRRYGLLPTLRTRLRDVVLQLRWLYFTRVWGMDLHPYTLISTKAKLDRTYPRGIHIGEGTAVNFGAVILTHDLVLEEYRDTRVGRNCMIGAHCILMPGVTIGDHSIVGAGAVVTKDVPPNSLVVGNPARVIRTDVQTKDFGRMLDPGTPVAEAPQ